MLARLEKPFVVESQHATFNNESQAGSAYVLPGITILALVGSAAPGQTIQYGGTDHIVTHNLSARGPAYAGAKPGDVLKAADGSSYFVLGIEIPGLENRWVVFFTELRRDLP